METAIAIAGFIFLALGVYQSRKSRHLRNFGIRVEGVVYAVEQERRSGIYYPIVRFRTKEGLWVTKKLDSGTNPPQYSEGARVNLLYDPEDPEAVNFDSDFNLVFLPGLFIAVGLGCWIFTLLYLFDLLQ